MRLWPRHFEGKLIGCTDAERAALVEYGEGETIALATVTVGYYAQRPGRARRDVAHGLCGGRRVAAAGRGAASDVLAAAASLLKSYQIDGASWQAPLAPVGRRAAAAPAHGVLDANPIS